MSIIKKIKVQNAPDVIEVTAFDGVESGTILKHKLEAAMNHFGIEKPAKDFDYMKEGSYLLGNENDSYCIVVSDADENELKQMAAELDAFKEANGLEGTFKQDNKVDEVGMIGKVAQPKGKESVDLEFTDSEEKSELIELLIDAVVKSTGGEFKGALRANFEAWANLNDDKINLIVGQMKVNGFKITAEQDEAFRKMDEAAGLRPKADELAG